MITDSRRFAHRVYKVSLLRWAVAGEIAKDFVMAITNVRPCFS